MNDCLDPNESKKSNESNSIAPISLDNKKESINPENGSSSLEKEGKEGKEGDILNNIISVPTKIYEDSEEEKKDEDLKIAKEKYENYFQKIDNICQEKNDYNEMPLFFEKSEPIIPLQNIPLNIEPPKLPEILFFLVFLTQHILNFYKIG